MVEPKCPGLSVERQCELLSISRSGFYYEPTGESPFNLTLMREIDETFMECPFYGSRQMTRHLCRLGHEECLHREFVSMLLLKFH